MSDNIQQMAEDLKAEVDALPVEDQHEVLRALSLIRSITHTFGEHGCIALSLAAAEFAAE